MRLSKHVEESLYVLLILATQKSHQPVKNIEISELLDVSDSSLKKLLRKLVVADLIESSASKSGGFELKKDIRQITLLDIIEAVEGPTIIRYNPKHIGDNIFRRKEHVKKSEKYIDDGLKQALDAYAESLNQIKIVNILEEESVKSGTIDWNNISAIDGSTRHELNK